MRTSLAFLTLLACACGSPSKTPASNEANSASAALQAISAKDQGAVAHCTQAVAHCRERRDAGPNDVCEHLAQHCVDLEQHLNEVREPAVSCLKGVQACQEHAGERAQCARDAAACEPIRQGSDQDGEAVIACGDRVQACWARVAALPEQARAEVSCENIRAACERVSALLEQAGRERGQGDEHANQHAAQAHDAMTAIDEDADQDGAEANDDDQGDEPHEHAGRHHGADAGTGRD